MNEAIMRNNVWFGNRPKALPEFVTYVRTIGPSCGIDSPNLILVLTKYLLNWSDTRVTAKTAKAKTLVIARRSVLHGEVSVNKFINIPKRLVPSQLVQRGHSNIWSKCGQISLGDSFMAMDYIADGIGL